MKYVTHLAKGFNYSLRGLARCWKYEDSFRIEVVVAIIATPVAFWIASNPFEWAALVSSLLLVLAFELVNSAIEGAVDLASPRRNETAERVKDSASAAVLLSIMIACFLWGSLAARLL